MKIPERLVSDLCISADEFYILVRFISLKDGSVFEYRIGLPGFSKNDNFGLFGDFVINYNNLIQRIFNDCRVEDCQTKKENGHPDFVISNFKGEKTYIEVKRSKERISLSQVLWFIKHANEDMYLMIVDGVKHTTYSIPVAGEIKYDIIETNKLEIFDF